MINPANRDLLRKDLIDISNLLCGLEHFIFYGTLLGIVRDGDIIEHDDDVDILVNATHRDMLISRLSDSSFEIDFSRPFNQKDECFLQAQRKVGPDVTYIDFYFF